MVYNLEVVRMLIGKGVHTDARTDTGHSALQYAASKNHPEVGSVKVCSFSFIQRASYEQVLQINKFNQESGRFFSDLHLIVGDEGFAPYLYLLLVQVELISRWPEPVHHLRTRSRIRLIYSTTTTVCKEVLWRRPSVLR